VSARPWHPRFHSDALNGMAPLTLEQRGAYQTVLDLIYDNGGPILDHARIMAGRMNCSVRKWESVRSDLLKLGKITISDGLICNRKAAEVIDQAAETARKLAENGSKGGRKRVENEKKVKENKEANQATLKAGLSIPHPEYSVSKDTGVPPADTVKTIFDMGIALLAASGYDQRASRSLVGRWRKQAGDEDVLAALVEARNRNISSLVEWMPKRLANAKPDPLDLLLEQADRYARQAA
jgi:uncharacterized protein YdaU (DUF1376 family)